MQLSNNQTTQRQPLVLQLTHLPDESFVIPRMCSAASAAALPYLPPLAACNASIAAINFCRALSWGGMNTFAFFGFLDAADFPAGRFG
jgi:hypothetical protein